MRTVKTLSLILIIAMGIGCAGTTVKETQPPSPLEAVLQRQENILVLLNRHIDQIEKQILEEKSLPRHPDPVLQEMNETDLAGMKLRVRQLTIIRDHCIFARGLILEIQKDPGTKQQALEAWLSYRKDMGEKLDELDQQVDRLERRRLDLGMRLVQESLQ